MALFSRVEVHVIIFGDTLQEQHIQLGEVFEKLREYHLKIECDKCEFLRTELNYLGHVVTGEGVKPDPHKLHAINKFPIPRTKQT
jgi:hypothetical protein